MTNPVVVSAAFTLIIDMEESNCVLGSTTVTADAWINRLNIIIYPEVTEYEFEQ